MPTYTRSESPIDRSALRSPATLHPNGSVTPRTEAVTRKNIFREPWAGSSLDTTNWTLAQAGTGTTAAVSSGTLVMTSGTVSGNEVSVTTVDTFQLPARVLVALQLSQRIANQATYVELFSVDPVTGLDDAQTFARWRLDATTATNGIYEVQEDALTPLSSAASTITTTASQSLFTIDAGSEAVQFSTKALNVATAQAVGYLLDGQIGDPNATYRLRIRLRNTGTAASSTTLTCSLVSVLEYHEADKAGRGAITGAQAIPAFITGSAASGVTVAVSGTTTVAGVAARNSSSPGNPLYVATGASANPAVVTTGRITDLLATLIGALIVKPFSIPEGDWSYAPSAAITNTTAVALKAAVASNRNYLTGITIHNTNGTATEVTISDGSTVIWRGYATATMAQPMTITFPSPIKTSVNAALNFACITTAANVYVNAQGYTAP